MRPFATLLAGAALALAVVTLAPACSGPRSSGEAPNVTFVGLGGQRFDLASLRGRTVLLNFWFYH